MNKEEILNYIANSDTINLDIIQEQISMNERKKYLENHDHNIWQTSGGEYCTYLYDENLPKHRKLIRRKTLKLVEDAIVEYYKKIENEPLFGVCFQEWINEKLSYGEIQQQTYDRYVADYKRYISDSVLHVTKIKDISEEILEKFIKTSIHNFNMTAKNWTGLKIILSGTMKYAFKKRYTSLHLATFLNELDLSPRMFRKKRMIDEEQVFTSDEIKQLTEYIDTHDITLTNLGILLALYTGVRSGELSSLKFSDIKNDVMTVSRTQIKYTQEHTTIREVRESTKGRDGIRKIILTKSAKNIIERIREINNASDYMFYENGKRLNAESFSAQLRRICKRIGILPRSMHKLRKTYATNLLDAGVPDKIIENQMGHTSIQTTKGFYYYNNKTIEDVRKILEDKCDYEITTSNHQ